MFNIHHYCDNQFCDNMCNIVFIVLDLVCVIFFFWVASLMGNSPFWQPATIVMYSAILLFYLWLIKFFFFFFFLVTPKLIQIIFKTIHRARSYNMHWQTIPRVNLREKVLTYIVPGEVLN